MVDTVRLDELFEVKRGHEAVAGKFADGPIAFVGSSGVNNGVTKRVSLANQKIIPFDPGQITVAMSGSVLATFVQMEPFICGGRMSVLSPRKRMTHEELLYYSAAISMNKVRYGYGRKADRTFASLQLPATPPDWVHDYSVDTILGEFDKAMVERDNDAGTADQNIDTSDWVEFRIGDLFDIKRGNVKDIKGLASGDVPVVSAKETNNGVAERADVVPQFGRNTLSVAMTGSVGYFAVQPEPWSGTGNTAGLKLKEHYGRSATVLCLLAIATLARQEGVRFNYGRIFSMGRLEGVTIRLPAVLNENDDAVPDWDRLDKKMQELAFSRYVATDSP